MMARKNNAKLTPLVPGSVYSLGESNDKLYGDEQTEVDLAGMHHGTDSLVGGDEWRLAA